MTTYLIRRLSLIAACLLSLGAYAVASPNTQSSQSAVCGNGLVETGENCKNCEADCEPLDCKAGAESYRVAIGLATHEAREPTAVTLHLSYRTNRLTIPGTGSDETVQKHVDFGQSGSGITAFNDLGHSIRIVRAEGKLLPNPLVTVELKGCEGAPPPTIEDLVCVVEGCAGIGGAIQDGCTCKMTLSKTPKSPASPK